MQLASGLAGIDGRVEAARFHGPHTAAPQPSVPTGPASLASTALRCSVAPTHARTGVKAADALKASALRSSLAAKLGGSEGGALSGSVLPGISKVPQVRGCGAGPSASKQHHTNHLLTTMHMCIALVSQKHLHSPKQIVPLTKTNTPHTSHHRSAPPPHPTNAWWTSTSTPPAPSLYPLQHA